MQLINLTVYKRNLVLVTENIAVNVDDLTTPIRFDANSKSYFTLKSKAAIIEPNAVIKNDYQVNENLAAIQTQSTKLLILTVIKRRNVDFNEVMVFNASKISDRFKDIGTGTQFYYIEDGDPEVVDYIVSEDIATIMAQQASGGGSQNDFEDSDSSFSGTAFILTNTPTFIYGVYLNGQRLTNTVDYTVSGDTITFLSPLSSDSVTVIYKY